MVKLYDMAMALTTNLDQKVLLEDKKSGRICFEGNVDQLLDYSELEYRKVVDISVKNGVLKLWIK